MMVGRGWFVSNWQRIISPNESAELEWEKGKTGRYIHTYTFFYGSTGQTRYELVVHLNVDGSDNATVYGQEIKTTEKT